jgi:hypothetical protein
MSQILSMDCRLVRYGAALHQWHNQHPALISSALCSLYVCSAHRYCVALRRYADFVNSALPAPAKLMRNVPSVVKGFTCPVLGRYIGTGGIEGIPALPAGAAAVSRDAEPGFAEPGQVGWWCCAGASEGGNAVLVRVREGGREGGSSTPGERLASDCAIVPLPPAHNSTPLQHMPLCCVSPRRRCPCQTGTPCC